MRFITPLILVWAIGQLFLADCMVPLKSQKKEAKNANQPLIYKRLRFDQNSLQTLRRFQKYLAVDEHQVRFQFNETLQADGENSSNKTNLVEYSYYQNDQVEASSINYDSLVFEAIDRAYFTKLIQLFVFSYDNVDDIAKASDKRLVSRSRCDKEMDYMMKQLAEVEHARLNPSATPGPVLNNALNAEFLTLMDSFGTEQPGLLMGNNYWPGNWRQCKKSRVFHRDPFEPSRSVDFRARYCIASIRSKHWDGLLKTRLDELESQRHFWKDQQRDNYARYHRIQIGVCLPESCDTKLKWRRHENLHKLVTYKLSEPLRSYDLMDFFCLPDEGSELRMLDTSSICFLALFGLWCCAILVATLCDVRARRRQNLELRGARQEASASVEETRAKGAKTCEEKLIDCLSYLKNLERLFETESCSFKQPGPACESAQTHSRAVKRFPTSTTLIKPTDGTMVRLDRLQFVNFFKVLATLAIVSGHLCMVIIHMGRYTLDYDGINEYLVHFQYSAVFFVDWHFAISGFLASYTAFLSRRVERHTAWSWLGTIVHRYLRLAPCYLLLVWFTQSLFVYLSDGPLWDYGTTNQTLRAVCRSESLIWPLTLTSNFHPIYEECIMPSWYIACDFQFFLLTPFLLALLHKSPLLGWSASLALTGASLMARFHRYLTDPRAKMLDLVRPKNDLYMRNNWDMYPTYLFPQYRVGSYLVGLLAGHYVYMVLSGSWSSALSRGLDLNKSRPVEAFAARGRGPLQRSTQSKVSLILTSAWSFSLTTLTSMLFATWFLFNLYPNELESLADYVVPIIYTVSHVSVAAAFALFMVLMSLGDYSTTRYFLSLPFWTVLSRFNFLIFIGQIELINLISGSSDSLIELNNIETFKYYMMLVLLLYLLSGLLTPLIEMPLGLLERTFVGPLLAPPQQKTRPDNPNLVAPSRNKDLAQVISAVNNGKKEDQTQAYELNQMAPGESTGLIKSESA